VNARELLPLASQLGLRVLEILRRKGSGGKHPSGWGKLAWIDEVEAEAVALGLHGDPLVCPACAVRNGHGFDCPLTPKGVAP